jgi:hypothetical protein
VFTQVLDQVQLVATEQDAGALLSPFDHDLPQCGDRHWVEARERFIEHEQIRFVYERHCQLYPLLIANRKLQNQAMSACIQSDALDPLLGPSRGLSRVQASEAAPRYSMCSRTCIRTYSPRSCGI